MIAGGYRILERIGHGGASQVYLAEDVSTGRRYAVKQFNHAEGAASSAGVHGFRTEAETLAKLRHGGLPRLEAVVPYEDTGLLVMEHIAGMPLDRMIAEYGAQPQEKVVGWALQICRILRYLHSQDPPLIYRDVKPSNLILRPDGRLCLIDFGAVREWSPAGREDTVLLGTRGYAAPEQYGGRGQSGPETDVYGLGATLYHLATGRAPSSLMFQPGCGDDREIGLLPAFQELIRKCTMVKPADRYARCADVERDLLKLRESRKKRSASVCTEPLLRREKKGSFVIHTEILIIYTSEGIE